MKRPSRWIVAVCAIAIAGGFYWYSCSHFSKDEIAASVKSSLQQKLASGDLAEYHMSVTKVDILHESGNRYKAMATIDLDGKAHQIGLTVVADGTQLAWEAPPGAFLFAAQEKIQHALQQIQTQEPSSASEAEVAAAVIQAQHDIDQANIPAPMPRDVLVLSRKWEALNNQCKAVGEGAATDACVEREQIYSQIVAFGWCWGHKDDISSERHWVQCGPNDA
ncbi:TPA: hypothetical protein QDB14_001087 [Burkholderia vietnamiensis]|nr:hypothetical protein [Burkholderia vietnamiensis]